jgi:DNA-binding NarL/FixJ family response regulator
MSEKLNIVIADDHDFIIQGIRNYFSAYDNYNIVGNAMNGIEALKIIENNHVDILITDVDMPEMNGIELAVKVKEFNPEIKIMAITMHIESWILKKLSTVGIEVILSKNTNCIEMNNALDALLNNRGYISPDIKDAIIESALSNNKQTKINTFTIKLTDRETEVLKLVAEELSNAEIASKLFISINTVETHRKNLFLKLGAKNSIGLVKAAIERNLI